MCSFKGSEAISFNSSVLTSGPIPMVKISMPASFIRLAGGPTSSCRDSPSVMTMATFLDGPGRYYLEMVLLKRSILFLSYGTIISLNFSLFCCLDLHLYFGNLPLNPDGFCLIEYYDETRKGVAPYKKCKQKKRWFTDNLQIKFIIFPHKKFMALN